MAQNATARSWRREVSSLLPFGSRVVANDFSIKGNRAVVQVIMNSSILVLTRVIMVSPVLGVRGYYGY